VTVVAGRVTRRDGEAAADAVVEVRNAGGDIVDQVKVDDRGGYVYHLRQGTWGLLAWDARGGRAKKMVNLAHGEDMVVDMELEGSR
jgi:hypothetical protein